MLQRSNGERVVEGAWHLSPSLGERMVAAELGGKPVFVRELLPQDLTSTSIRWRGMKPEMWPNIWRQLS